MFMSLTIIVCLRFHPVHPYPHPHPCRFPTHNTALIHTSSVLSPLAAPVRIRRRARVSPRLQLVGAVAVPVSGVAEGLPLVLR